MQQRHPAYSHTHAHGIPPGGYVPIPVLELLRAWEAYRREIIGLRDLRAWLACHELVARRSAAQKATRRVVPLHYSESELHALLGGVGGEHVRASLRALTQAGLLEWSTTAVHFPTESLREPEPELDRLVTLVRNVRRAVPVPRRVLRHLAREGTRATAATMLGHLLRCAYRRRLSCSWRGRCSSAWVAELTGVDERSVKRARSALVGGGWLRGDAGSRTRPWLAEVWEVLAGPERTGVSPAVPQSTTGLSPARRERDLLRNPEYHKLSVGPGLKSRAGRARLRAIQAEDLHDPHRLTALHERACTEGLAIAGEAGLLAFMSLAARARRCATRNAPGLLAWLLRHQRWNFPTGVDEDAARRLWLHAANRAGPNRSIGAGEPASVGVVVTAILRETIDTRGRWLAEPAEARSSTCVSGASRRTTGTACDTGAWSPGRP